MKRAGEMSAEPRQTDTVVVMLTVPRHWRKLSEREIERVLRMNRHIMPMLAHEVKRFQGTDSLNLTELRKFLEEREAL